MGLNHVCEIAVTNPKGQHNLAATSSLQDVLVTILINDGGTDMVAFMVIS